MRVPALVAAVALLMVACGGEGDGSSENGGAPTTPATASMVIDRTAPPVTGLNRLLFALLDEAGDPLPATEVNLRFFFIDPAAGNRKTYKSSVDAVPLASGSGQAADLAGVYRADIAFDMPGEWVVELTGAIPGGLPTLEESFSVGTESQIPGRGDPAPLLGDSGQAPGDGRPAVVVFSDAEACLLSYCGSVKDAAMAAEGDYGEEAAFTYTEAGDGSYPDWVRERWGIESGSIVFVVDDEGFIRYQLQTVVSYEELASALDGLLAP